MQSKNNNHIRYGASRLFVAASLLLSTGCAQLRDPYMVDALINGTKAPNAVTENRNRTTPDHKDVDETDYKDVDNTDQFVPQPINLATYEITLYEQKGGRDDPIRKPVIELANWSTEGRNSTMDFLIMRSDIICEKHTAAIISGTAATNFVLAEITTVLSGLGAIFTPTSTVRALSGAASISNATRAQYNEAVLQNMLNTTVVAAIRETRKGLLDGLEARRLTKIESYSGYQMIDEVVRYHQACSFYSGLVALKDAAQKIRPSSAEVNESIENVEARLDAVRIRIKDADKDGKPELKLDLESLEKSLTAEYSRLIHVQPFTQP